MSGEESLCGHDVRHHIMYGCDECHMPPLGEDKTAQMLGLVPTPAEHMAGLASMLKEFYWQGMTNAGSQALADELYRRGARAPYGHFHPPEEEADQ